MYFNTKLMADRLRNFYFDDSTEWSRDPKRMNNEETPIWWIGFNNDMFMSMSKSFNFQMLWYLAKDYKDVIEIYKGFRGRFHRKTRERLPPFITNNIFGSRYRDAVTSAIGCENIIHFAGSFPYPYFRI